MKFKVVDIVTAKSNKHYTLTNQGSRLEVMSVKKNNEMNVKLLEHSERNEKLGKKHLGEIFPVSANRMEFLISNEIEAEGL